MRWLFIGLLVCRGLLAEDRWLMVASGPFEVYSSIGEKAARERLNDLEQFRQAVGVTIGKQDLKLVWPLRVLLFKKQTPVAAGNVAIGRDAYMAGIDGNSPLPPAIEQQVARLLLEQNTNRLPESIENGLVTLFSTVDISGTHITLGAPVPPAERTRDWARMHLLTVDPSYSGRTRVLISNLEQSPDMDAADHNAFEKTPAQIEKQVDAYLQAGTFTTTTVSGRALNPMRDFHPRPLESDAGKLAVADLMLSTGQGAQAKPAYLALHGPEAAEGLGLIALAAGNKAEARQLFASAAESGSKSSRLWLNLALLETDPAKSRSDLHHAADLNPNWSEPWRHLADFDPNPAQKIADLKKATSLDRRNASDWQELARVAAAANQFDEAAKAWAGAARAAANDQERERIRAARLQIEQERADFVAAEKKREAEEEARHLESVKQATMADIHTAEEAARKKMNPDGAPIPKATIWMDELNGSGNVQGTLERFDCLGRVSRLVIKTSDGKVTQLAVRDVGKIGLTSGEKMMSCGAQNPARWVVVRFIAQPDKKLGTVGDATTIDFR